jgi:hypothetical protein
MPLLSTIGAAAARAFGFLRSLISGYNVANSLRFNSASSDYLSRTPASTTNQRTYTISCWYKRMNTGLQSAIIGVNPAGSSFFSISIDASGTYANKLGVYWYDGTTDYGYYTDMLFRDFSAWYHIVVAVDTTQATSGDRLKVYVNGIQQTLTAVYGSFTQNLDTYYNSNVAHYIGASGETGTPAINGYLSEFYSIDGQALTPSSFGETDTASGIWKPKAYTGTYGTNGFELEFKNSASLGTDSSGNGNTWTVNNLTSVDQSTDTPTNNFDTLNPLFAFNNAPTFSNGNLTVVTAAGDSTVISTIGVTTGKWYFEAKVGATATGAIIGILGGIDTIQNTGFNCGYFPQAFAYYGNDGRKINNNTYTSYGNSYTTGDVIGVAFDLINGKIWFAKNGTWQNSGDPAAGTNAAFTTLSSTVTYFAAFGDASGASTSTFDVNFGSPTYSANSYTDGAGYGNFSYAVPSGFYAINTKNLANFG